MMLFVRWKSMLFDTGRLSCCKWPHFREVGPMRTLLSQPLPFHLVSDKDSQAIGGKKSSSRSMGQEELAVPAENDTSLSIESNPVPLALAQGVDQRAIHHAPVPKDSIRNFVLLPLLNPEKPRSSLNPKVSFQLSGLAFSAPYRKLIRPLRSLGHLPQQRVVPLPDIMPQLN